MQAALRTRLATALAALVGDRVAWGERPVVLRSIRLSLVAPGYDYTHQGRTDLAYAWVQADVFGLDQPGCWAAADALETAIEAAATVSGIRFENGFIESRRDGEPEHMDGDVRIFSTSLDFRFYWKTA